VVGVAGRIDFDARAEVERLLGDLQPRNGDAAMASAPAPTPRSVLVEQRDSEQAYLCLGAQAYPLDHPDRYVLTLITALLGTGMSSRLNDELVSRRALAYFVFAVTSAYVDCGSMWAQTGVDVDRVDEAVGVIARELRRLAAESVPAEELEKARNMMKGHFAFQLETPDGLLTFGLKREVVEGALAEPAEVLAGFEAVSREDVQRVARDLLGEKPLSLAVIGPFDDESRFERLLA
jgi:predicted Zn-dependent peptidase